MNHIPRKPTGPVVLVLVFAAAILMASGCTDTPREGAQVNAASLKGMSQEKTVTATGAAVSTVARPTTVQQTAAPDSPALYIAIDPVGDKKIGDLLVFSGTTNLPEKTPVYLSRHVGPSEEEKIISNREVFAGADGTTRWRFVSDSSGLEPGEYSVTVATGKKEVKASEQFTLSGTRLRPENVIYYSGTTKKSGTIPSVMVDPVQDHKQGEVFLISGTSSLEEGTLLLCSIYPVYFEDRSKRPATRYKGPSGSATDTVIVRGSGGLNRWSCALDTYAIEKTEYIVNVSTVSEDYPIREVFGRARFTLR